MFMLILNELVKIAHLQKLANQLMLKGAFVIEMVNNSFSASKENFDKARKRSNQKLK